MSCLIFFIAECMPMSLTLTCVPEKRGEVHSEHKLSTLSLSSRNEIFPKWPEPAQLPFHFQLCGSRGGQGPSFPNAPSCGPVGGVRPQHSGAWRAGWVADTSRAGSVSVGGELWPAAGCLCLEISWYLVAPSHSTNVDMSIIK